MSATLNWFRINGIQMPAPSKIDWSMNPIWEEETGRDQTGTSHGHIVAWKRKIEIEYPYACDNAYYTVLKALESAGDYFPVTYWDMADNAPRTSMMYVNAPKGGFYTFNNYKGLTQFITSPITFHLIEQ